MMKLIEVTKDGKKLLIGEGRVDITKPVEIKFIVDESDFNKLNDISEYYKWSLYEVLKTFCEDAEIYVSDMEGRAQGLIK